MLKQVCLFASLLHNIYDMADPTPVDVDHDARQWAPSLRTQRIMTTHLL